MPALQNVVSKFIVNCNNSFCDDRNIQIESFTVQILQECINEDSLLFLRCITEKLIQSRFQKNPLKYLRSNDRPL